MYIEPNTEVRILHECPLDTTYDHTIYFASPEDQENYFKGLTKSPSSKYTLTQQSYQRVKRGYMRVAIKAEDLYDCNYLMFKNSSFGNKWFYAFIKSVDYINNITSEIVFEIDVMQTWYFDYDLKECFVEREHSLTDNIGDNLVPENLETGEYVSDDFDATGKLGGKSIVVACTFNEKYENVGGAIYSGLFSGLYFNVFPSTTEGAEACANFINGAGAKSSGIVYCDDRADSTFKLKITVTTDDHELNYVMLKRNDFFLTNLRYFFERGCFRFKDLRCKEAVLKALSY